MGMSCRAFVGGRGLVKGGGVGRWLRGWELMGAGIGTVVLSVEHGPRCLLVARVPLTSVAMMTPPGVGKSISG